MAVEPEVRRMGLAPKDAISRESGGMSRTGPVSGRTYARTHARRCRDESSQAGGGEEEESRGDLALGTGNCITPGPS